MSRQFLNLSLDWRLSSYRWLPFGLVVGLAACGNPVDQQQGLPITSSGGSSSAGAASLVAGGSAGLVSGGSGGQASGGAGVQPTGPGLAMGGLAGSGAAGTSNGGSGGGRIDEDATHDHCLYGEDPDPRDALLPTPGAPDIFTASNGDVDLPLPKPVLDWMDERVWKQSHDAWHNIRRCRGGGPATGLGGGMTTSAVDICSHTELVPSHQECADAEDGYEFLVMHRHMMVGLRQAFPNHLELFQGFPHFPFAASDVPEQWRSRFGSGWTQQILDVANTLENIESHLDQFPTEGDLGKYIQCGGMSNGASSIHGALHFKWVVNESPNSLGKQAVNIGNFMFWKLHGWIDQIWERYRAAKGLTDEEPKLKDALADQCRGMHQLGLVFDPSLVEDDFGPLPVEHGYFHETVRPILDRVCSGCHSESSPEARMSLGGHISSAYIVKDLVNVKSFYGGDFVRVVPGHPEQSWLYLKAAGMAASAGCTGSMCNTESMPPGATADKRLTSAELATLSQWISDGAQAPTQ